jgi:hypothetical protein|tara:strand:+ start:749 stop:1177 length:429 start_codon:yes stop_codon:yes gene_type:complete
MNPFEHVKNLHTKKRRWEDFNDEEKKSFNVFIINKTLSFNPNYLNIVNMVQNYTGLNQVLSQKEVFNLYYSLLPTKFRFYRWIKGEKSKKDKEKAEYLAMHFNVSTREAYDYLQILDKKSINKIIKNYKNDTSRKTIQSTKK